MTRRPATAAALLVLLALAATAAPARGDDVEKDRRRVAEIATKLEDAPLAKSAKKDRQRVLTLINSTPGLKIEPCRALLGDLLLIKRLEAQFLYVQFEISAAKFLVENPDAAGDRERTLAGALEGVLRTYDAMRRANPALTIEFVDDLAERARRDGVDQIVRDAACP